MIKDLAGKTDGWGELSGYTVEGPCELPLKMGNENQGFRPRPRRGSERVREGVGRESRGSKLPEARLATPSWPQRPPGWPGPAKIKAIFIFNNHGKPQLSKFYQPMYLWKY